MTDHNAARKTYYVIFAALLAFTFLTVTAAKIDLGRLNTIVAIAIAVTKALLVVLFFMHVRDSSRLTKLVVAGGFLWLALMIGLTMADFSSRNWIGLAGK